jgi:iron complex transport system substrate-binding protein
MSINQCTDQLLLAVLPPDRIASVTWLSRDPESSLMAAEARRVPINHGGAEEVVRQRPDLVVAGTVTTPATRALLKRLGYPLLEIGPTSTFADIRDVTRQVARAVGEDARGEMLIARMDRQLAELARTPAPAVRLVAWDGAGFSASPDSLYNAVLEAAGAINVANRPPANTYRRPDVEVLLQAAPTVLVTTADEARAPDLRGEVAQHPLIRRFWPRSRTLTVRQADYQCGTPRIADSVVRLRKELRAAAKRVRAPQPSTASSGS